MYVDLFYGLPNEPKNFKRRYFFEKKPRFKSSWGSQTLNYVSAVLCPNAKNKSGYLTLEIVNNKGEISTSKVSYSLLYGSTIYYERWLNDGAYIKKFMLNDVDVEVEIEM